MNWYENLLDEAYKNNITVIEKDFKSNAKGLIKGCKIGIRKNLSTFDKTCVLAEELGHYYKTVGNILDQKDIRNKKQELIARKWAYKKLVPIEKLVEANLNQIKHYELAEYLNVTDEFLTEAILYYKSKYGMYINYKNYILMFEPFGLLESFDRR